MSSVSDSRPRIIATIDGEIDNRCSMIRFLMYANEWNIEGLIYCSSRFHWDGHDWAGTDWIEGQINKYAQVYENLIKHDTYYPSPAKFRELYTSGTSTTLARWTRTRQDRTELLRCYSTTNQVPYIFRRGAAPTQSQGRSRKSSTNTQIG